MKLRTNYNWEMDHVDRTIKINNHTVNLNAGRGDKVEVFDVVESNGFIIVTRRTNMDYFGVEFYDAEGKLEDEFFFQGEWDCKEVHPRWDKVRMMTLAKTVANLFNF